MTLAFPKPTRQPKPKRRIKRNVRPHRMRVRASRGQLRELADAFMSLYIRHQAGWTCWVCGSKRLDQQMMHLFGKGANPAGRYLEDNARTGCRSCHKRYTHRPEEWGELLRARLGECQYQRLRETVLVRQGAPDYMLWILYYWRKLAAMEDLWKVQERFDRLVGRGRNLELWP